jgi:hypothetical protein
MRDEISLNPDYQRQADIWPLSKKQLLIDTLINGYDLPKIYLHEFQPPKQVNGDIIRYAVVDGKQRMQAIWEFIEGKFPLAENFCYLPNSETKISDMFYKDIAEKHPRIKMRFDSLSLPIFAIRTDDLELIEDMFTRLNEGAPLNAAEKRNTFGGPIPIILRDLATHPFLEQSMHFNNRRYRHLDLICKFMLLENENKFTDTKKIQLDRFVKGFTDKKTADELKSKVFDTLELMSESFIEKDPLLKSSGLIPVYYILSKVLSESGITLDRQVLLNFESKRKENRQLIQSDEYNKEVDFELIEFDRLSQSSNDTLAMKSRLHTLVKHLYSGLSSTDLGGWA